MGTFGVGTRPGEFVLALFGEPSTERVVGVFPNLGIAGGLFDFGADELVFEVVLIILVFAIGQLAVDQVAQCVVGVFDAVVFFEAVAAANVTAFALPFGRFVGKDVVGGVEGEGFAAAGLAVAGFLNASDFVVNVIEYAASLVGTLNQVAGFVVGVAAVDGAAGQRFLFAAECLCAVLDGTLAFQTAHGVVVVQAADAALCPLDFAVQFVALDVADDFAVEADLVQVSAAVVQVINMAAVGKDGADAVAQRVVSVAYSGALAVVDGGFADEAVEFVVDEFDAAVMVAGFGQVAGNQVVFETGAADAFVFALSVAAGDFAALLFDQLAEDVAFEMMDVPSLGAVFQTTLIGALAVFGLLNQLSGGIVAVGGNFAVPAGFLDQVVGLVVIETVGFAVFVGKDGQTAGFVVGIGKGMAQRVDAFERQSVHCEFVGGFGTESIDVGGQTVEAVVFEGFVTAVGIVGTDGVARCVVVVSGGMAQRIGNGFEIAVFGVTETGGFAGTVGKADELIEGVVV